MTERPEHRACRERTREEDEAVRRAEAARAATVRYRESERDWHVVTIYDLNGRKGYVPTF